MNLQVYNILNYERRTKVHIYDYDAGKCLCGHDYNGSCTGVDATLKWVEQPDPDEQICKACKRRAIELLKWRESNEKDNVR